MNGNGNFGSMYSSQMCGCFVGKKSDDRSKVHSYKLLQQLAKEPHVLQPSCLSPRSPHKSSSSQARKSEQPTLVAIVAHGWLANFRSFCQLPHHVSPCNCPAQRSRPPCHHHILGSERSGNVWSFGRLRPAEHNEKITWKGATMTSKGIHDCNVPESTRAVSCNTIELTKHDIVTLQARFHIKEVPYVQGETLSFVSQP